MDLWKRAKVPAMDDRTDLNAVCIEALEAHLQKGESDGKK